MKPNELIDNQFREATENAEKLDFDRKDNIWDKVEAKLDDGRWMMDDGNADRRRRFLLWFLAAAAVLIAGAGYMLWQYEANNDQAIPRQELVQEPTQTDDTTKISTFKPPIIEFKNVEPEKKQSISKPETDANTVSRYIPKQVTIKDFNPKTKVPEPTNVKQEATFVYKPAAPPTLLQNDSIIRQPNNLVIGQLIDHKGMALQGASVTIAGTKTATSTDNQGRFKLYASAKQDLDIAMIGFENKRISASNAWQKPIALTISNNTLNDVVVVGYGVQKKMSITGSVTTVSGKAIGVSNQQQNRFSKKAFLNKQNPLTGNVAGVQVNGTTSFNQKTADGSVRIRGAATLNGNNQPLVVVNGVPMPYGTLQRIDPGNIESLNILKDANASALYGSRGVNGVILLKTKNLSKKQLRRLEKLNKEMQEKGISFNTGTTPTVPEQYGTEAYDELVENPFTAPAAAPLSTFSIDVDNAAYTNIRRFINMGQAVPKGAVRVEEMINFFKYELAAPTNNDPFAISTVYSDAPWNPAHKLLKIGLQGKDIPADALPPSNLVFLVDVSGSMSADNKLPLLKQAMEVLVKELREQDKVSMVVYAGAAGLVLPPTSGTNKETILKALDRLSAGGSTAGGQGIELAYKTAMEHFMPKGNNRVILATDGDFNVGLQSNTDMETLIEEKRKTGVFLTVLGFGMGNYKDDKLELLADKGNGNYAYIDNLPEAKRFLGKEFKGSMFTIAKDVKLQIEFNPQQVQAYRLIGYENRLLAAEDFANDTVDAGEMGVGHTVTALYEIIPAGIKSNMAPALPTLKYSTASANETGKTYAGELATIKYRFKQPNASQSVEKSQTVAANPLAIATANDDFRFAAAVAWFGLALRQSTLIVNKDQKAIINLAKSGMSKDVEGYRAEFVRLVEAAKW